MADTTSIASRMEKLAKLKRMKSGLSDMPSASEETDSAETAIAMPAPTTDDSAPELHDAAALGGADTAFEDAFGGSREEAPAAAPHLSNAEADQPNTSTEFDFAGGASDDLGEADFSADASDKTNESNLEIPADLQDAVTENDEDVPDEDASGSAMTAADLGIDDEAMDALDDLVALAGMGELAEEDPVTPDFTMAEIDPELLEREFEHETAESAAATDVPMSSEEDGGRVAVTFDESRTTLLNHVSRQMNCSVEDVVVTALDWYLDALFGEDEEAKAG